jgi:hypothetical protein
MFMIESASARPEDKIKPWMIIIFLLKGSFGALFTMHVNVKPAGPVRQGFNCFGFPRRHRQAPGPKGNL